jgi:hypothetical protein
MRALLNSLTASSGSPIVPHNHYCLLLAVHHVRDVEEWSQNPSHWYSHHRKSMLGIRIQRDVKMYPSAVKLDVISITSHACRNKH